MVAQLVVRRERLEPERRVRLASFEDLDLGEPRRGDVLPALVARRVPGDQVVRHVARDGRVPLGHDGADVLLDGVVRVREVQGIETAPPAPEAQRAGVG